MKILIKILTSSNCDLSEINVVIVPAPAIIGKASGTMEWDPVEIVSFLKIFLPSVISRPIRNKINAPATANELVSTPKKAKINLPAKKNPTMISPDTKVA
jgi:hypothetical protein